MKIFKNKKQKVNSTVLDTIHLEYARKNIERLKPINNWFVSSINKEAETIVKNNNIPTTLCLKYQFENPIGAFMSHYGILTVVIDSEMDCILKVK